MLLTIVLFIIFCPTYLINELCAVPSCRWLHYINPEETPTIMRPRGSPPHI